MPVRTILAPPIVMLLFFSGVLLAQEKAQQSTTVHPPPVAPATQEFPVTMRQNVVAGKTAVGTKVEARLTMATFMSGKVVPEGAVFSGVVVESAARSTTSPSRLGIRMNSVQWKKDSIPVKAYVTSWYYPVVMETNDASKQPSGGIHGDIGMQRGGGSRSGGPGSTFPSSSQQGPEVPPQPASNISDHRVEMKDVESERTSDGSLAIKSSRVNIKLDRSTTYVLATGELAASK